VTNRKLPAFFRAFTALCESVVGSDNKAMNSQVLFSMALGMPTPRQVKDLTFSTDELARSELHLPIDFVPVSRFLYNAIEIFPEHDTVEGQWQHLSFF